MLFVCNYSKIHSVTSVLLVHFIQLKIEFIFISVLSLIPIYCVCPVPHLWMVFQLHLYSTHLNIVSTRNVAWSIANKMSSSMPNVSSQHPLMILSWTLNLNSKHSLRLFSHLWMMKLPSH